MLHTRLRPHCKDFLEKVARLYELHVFTFGSRLYAHTIAGEFLGASRGLRPRPDPRRWWGRWGLLGDMGRFPSRRHDWGRPQGGESEAAEAVGRLPAGSPHLKPCRSTERAATSNPASSFRSKDSWTLKRSSFLTGYCRGTSVSTRFLKLETSGAFSASLWPSVNCKIVRLSGCQTTQEDRQEEGVESHPEQERRQGFKERVVGGRRPGLPFLRRQCPARSPRLCKGTGASGRPVGGGPSQSSGRPSRPSSAPLFQKPLSVWGLDGVYHRRPRRCLEVCPQPHHREEIRLLPGNWGHQRPSWGPGPCGQEESSG